MHIDQLVFAQTDGGSAETMPEEDSFPEQLVAFLSSLDFGESAAQSIEDIVQVGGERENIYGMSVPTETAPFLTSFLPSPRCFVVESMYFSEIDLKTVENKKEKEKERIKKKRIESCV
ncbi:hypothetical protein L484_000150 [Morus notabilis]|uniref:Uncharacterized protein n=1 Tax=Morus notabilis TaxID=981085 RepID=W9SQD2_9ROSA|nr:hypothetical protein L484_000150 [Morus notabilis]